MTSLVIRPPEARDILKAAGIDIGIDTLREGLRQQSRTDAREVFPFGFAVKVGPTWTYTIYRADLDRYIRAHTS